MPWLRIKKDDLDPLYRISDDPSVPACVEMTEAEYARMQAVFKAFFNVQDMLSEIVHKHVVIPAKAERARKLAQKFVRRP